MERTGLFDRLATSRYLLETATARFAQLSDGVVHPRATDARNGLQTAGTAVGHAAGGLSRWTRTWIGMAILGVASWTVAALTGQFLGLADGWTLAISLTVACGLSWPINVVNNALARWVNRRRTRPPDSPPPIVVSPHAGPAAEVQQLLRMARIEMSAAMRQRCAAGRFGHLAATAAGFEWLRVHDQQLHMLCLADRYICNVIHSIELWPGARAEQR